MLVLYFVSSDIHSLWEHADVGERKGGRCVCCFSCVSMVAVYLLIVERDIVGWFRGCVRVWFAENNLQISLSSHVFFLSRVVRDNA